MGGVRKQNRHNNCAEGGDIQLAVLIFLLMVQDVWCQEKHGIGMKELRITFY